MKQTVVPAQVTTIEDRIAGSLGMSQLMLLAAPIFGGSALFVILPPVFHGAVYKLIVIGLLFVVCSLLAIRIKGMIVLLWLVIVLRYNFRPSYYLFDKNSAAHREDYRSALPAVETVEASKRRSLQTIPSLTTADTARVLEVINNPDIGLKFETNKKGRLYVRITEIKPEG